MSNSTQAITEILASNTEESVIARISDAMWDYVDEDDVEDHGGILEAYEEVGRGAAESQILQELISPYGLTGDDYVTVSDALQTEWCISTN